MGGEQLAHKRTSINEQGTHLRSGFSTDPSHFSPNNIRVLTP